MKLIVAVCVVALATVHVDATVLIPAGLPELVSEAHTIVEGSVVSADPRTESGSRRVETLVTVAAVDYLKGNLGRRVTFRVPGGQIGFRRTVMIGAPVFRPGDRVLLFLAGAAPSLPWIVGLNQGVYRVKTAPRLTTGKWSEELQVTEDQPTHVRSNATASSVSLSLFKARVRTLVRAGEGAR